MAGRLLLTNARLLDGQGAFCTQDVLIERDRIAEVATSICAEAERMDLLGSVLVPGFVDAHAHAEWQIWRDTEQASATAQGVTTYLLGQDGTSIAPRGPRTAEIDRYFAAVNGRPPAGVEPPSTIGDWLAACDERSAVNAAVLVPHGNLRLNEIGWVMRAASTGELDRMRQRLLIGLDQGARGMSTGLDYMPSAQARSHELTVLCRALAARDALYVTHMRGYGRNVELGMNEVTALARETGVKVHVSHFSGTSDEVLRPVDEALAKGVDLTFDTYPYTSSQTLLSMIALPAEWFLDGPDGCLRRLDRVRDGGADERMVTRRMTRRAATTVVVGHAQAGVACMAGRTLAQIAEASGVSVGRAVIDLLAITDLDCGAILHRDTFTPEDVRAVAAHPRHMTGSDGIYVGERPHPRGYATFATLARQQLDGTSGWTWAQFVQHTSTFASQRFSLGRGTLEPGAIADLVALGDVHARATFDQPRAPASGVTLTMVSGVPVLRDGVSTGATPGRGLR